LDVTSLDFEASRDGDLDFAECGLGGAAMMSILAAGGAPSTDLRRLPNHGQGPK
jgi:hypothetical protein